MARRAISPETCCGLEAGVVHRRQELRLDEYGDRDQSFGTAGEHLPPVLDGGRQSHAQLLARGAHLGERQDTEDLTQGRYYYYRLTPDGYLYRYASPKTTAKTQVFENGVSLRTVEFDRTIDWQGGKADVLLTNLTNGSLRQYIIPHTTPTKGSTRDLKTAGWAGFRQFSTMFCGDKGRIIMGYHDNRTVGVYYDPNSYDFNGGDITGRMTTLPALPAGTLAYG